MATSYPVVGTYLTPLEITCLLIATILCFLRVYGRLVIQGKPRLALDDYFVLVALLCAYIVTPIHIVSEKSWNLGRHKSDVSDYHISQIFLAQFISEWAFPVGNACVKLSILAFYLTFLSPHVFPRLRKSVYFIMGFIVLWSLGLSVVITCACRPVKKWWRTEIPGSCINDYALGGVIFIQQAMNLISDLIVFLLPIKTLWVLQASRGKKIRMILLLGLGFIVCLVALIRIPVILALLLRTDHDISWYTYPFFVTVAVELDLTIACACIPFCRPVAHRVAPAIKRISHGLSSHSTKFTGTWKSSTTKSQTKISDGTNTKMSTMLSRRNDATDRDVEMGTLERGGNEEITKPREAALRTSDEDRGMRTAEYNSSTESLHHARTESSGSQELVGTAPVGQGVGEPERLFVPVRNIRRMESLEMAITQSPTRSSEDRSQRNHET